MEALGLKCSSAREPFKSIPNATHNGTIDAQLSNGALLITAVKKKMTWIERGKEKRERERETGTENESRERATNYDFRSTRRV